VTKDKSGSKDNRQQPADDAAPLKKEWTEYLNKEGKEYLSKWDKLINPSPEEFKNELQYDVKVWLAERESDAALKEPFELMIAFALICAVHAVDILILSRDLKSCSALGRTSSFSKCFLICNDLYVLSAVHQRLRNLPDDEWDRWPVTGGSYCFGIHELSVLSALDIFCTKVEISSFEWIFRWVWSITGRQVDCDPGLLVIKNAIIKAGIFNYIEWSRRFNLDIFEDSELFPGSGDACFPEIIFDECDLYTELDRVMLELRYEHHEAIIGLAKSGGQGEKIQVDPADFKKSKSWNLLQDLLDDDLRQGISISKRRHGEYQPRKLRRMLRQKAKDKRNPKPQYVKIAENIKPVGGKVHTFKLDIPHQKVDYHRSI